MQQSVKSQGKKGENQESDLSHQNGLLELLEFEHEDVPDVFNESINEKKGEINEVVMKVGQSVRLLCLIGKPELNKGQQRKKQIKSDDDHSSTITFSAILCKLYALAPR